MAKKTTTKRVTRRKTAEISKDFSALDSEPKSEITDQDSFAKADETPLNGEENDTGVDMGKWLNGALIDLAKQHRVPVRLLADYLAIIKMDGDKAGDKSPIVVEWLRDNLTPEEFAHKYAHRGIK